MLGSKFARVSEKEGTGLTELVPHWVSREGRDVMDAGAVSVRPASTEDLPRLEELHREGIPGIDYRTPYIRYRLDNAPELTLGCYHGDHLVGFISGSRYHGDETTEEAYCRHIPTGETVHLISMVVAKSHRRQGLGGRLVDSFVEVVKSKLNGVKRIKLITLENLFPLYTKAGFKVTGPSGMKYENFAWFDLEMEI